MIYYLEQTSSTNTWAKEHLSQLQDGDAVFTQNQTNGKGRLGRRWENLAGCGLYYTAIIQRPMADPSTLPLYASLAAANAIFKITAQMPSIKWPNDLLLNCKKVSGILCECVSGVYLCGIGINLCHPQSYFDQQNLPYGTSLLLQGAKQAENPKQFAEQLAQQLTHSFTTEMNDFCTKGFSCIAEQYRQQCINLGREVWIDGMQGTATGIDPQGRLIVQTPNKEDHIFTGEVSIKGIYGHL